MATAKWRTISWLRHRGAQKARLKACWLSLLSAYGSPRPDHRSASRDKGRTNICMGRALIGETSRLMLEKIQPRQPPRRPTCKPGGHTIKARWIIRGGSSAYEE